MKRYALDLTSVVLVPTLATRETFAQKRADYLQDRFPDVPRRFALAAARASMAREWDLVPYHAAREWDLVPYHAARTWRCPQVRDLANSWAFARCRDFAEKQAVGGGAS